MNVVLHICVHIIYDVHVWPEGSSTFPRTGVTDDYESPYRGWKSNPTPSEEQRLLLINKLSLQPYIFILYSSKLRVVHV